MSKKKRIILGVTASIAAYKSADIIRRLIEKGFDCSVIMTKNAEKFITPLTLANLSGKTVYMKMFTLPEKPGKIVHIDLAQNADILLIAPATANIIGKIAHGIADDLLSCVAMATRVPIMIAPAMNTQMYNNKIFQTNCNLLKNYGMHFIEPISGKLACGEIGQGHLADVQTIVTAVCDHL